MPVKAARSGTRGRPPLGLAGSGGVSSSVRDLSQWLRLQLGNGALDGKPIVNADALAETRRPEIVSNPAANPSTDRAGFCGLGWNVSYTNQGLVQLSHSGAFELGAATAVYMLPSEQLGIIVLTNAAPIGVPEAVALSFLDLATQGKVQRDWLALLRPLFAALAVEGAPYSTDYSKPPVPAAAALPLDAYVGTYRNDFFGDIQIVQQGGELSILEGPKQIAFALHHYDHDVFVYQPVGESAGGPAGATFTIGPDQRATSVVVENLNIKGQGAFTRSSPTPP